MPSLRPTLLALTLFLALTGFLSAEDPTPTPASAPTPVAEAAPPRKAPPVKPAAEARPDAKSPEPAATAPIATKPAEPPPPVPGAATDIENEPASPEAVKKLRRGARDEKGNEDDWGLPPSSRYGIGLYGEPPPTRPPATRGYEDEGYGDDRSTDGRRGSRDDFGRARTLDGDWDDLESGPEFRVALYTSEDTYAFDDPVTIYFRASRDARVWIFSRDDRGTVRQLLPNYYNRNNQIEGDALYRIPSRRYSLRAGAPEGRRRLLIVALDAGIPNPVPTMNVGTNADPFPVVRDLGGAIERIRDAAERGRNITTFRNGRPGRWNTYTPGAREDTYAEDRTTIQFTARPYGYEPPGNGFSGPPPIHDQANAGRLNLTSSPTRAEVYLDGEYYGRTPLNVQVPQGSYELTIYRDGYRTYQEMIDIRRTRTKTMSVRLIPDGRFDDTRGPSRGSSWR